MNEHSGHSDVLPRMNADVKRLYTERLDAYLSFNAVFRYAEALKAFFRSYDGLGPGLRILDAGCGPARRVLRWWRRFEHAAWIINP